MENQVDAIYENGAFRPVGNTKLDYPEGTRVILSVTELEPSSTALTVLDLAAGVYKGLSQDEIEEIERLALDRQNFFKR